MDDQSQSMDESQPGDIPPHEPGLNSQIDNLSEQNSEPTVLDLVKSILTPWRGKKISIPKPSQGAELNDSDIEMPLVDQWVDEGQRPIENQPEANPAFITETSRKPRSLKFSFPWMAVLALLMAIIAQGRLEGLRKVAEDQRDMTLPLILYAAAALLAIFGLIRNEWSLPDYPPESDKPFSMKIRWIPLAISLPFLGVAFLAFGGNRFTAVNLILWAIGIIYVMVAVWQPGKSSWLKRVGQKIFDFIRHPQINLKISGWVLLFLAAFILVAFFRFYRLSQVPGEAFSDQAEKLLDVSDVLNGQYSIFFPRNTGREAFQMYLTASIASLLGTGITFISLKIGTALAGLFTLPYIYLLGKEIANRWVGLIAMVLCGIAYWPNVISRIGLRFPLYPLFVAPVLYYLIKGLRNSDRNSIVLAGIFLGIGLHGYSPMRIVPIILIFTFLLYILHKQSKGRRIQAVFLLGIIGVVSLVIFLPLGRYWLENPDMFGYRALTRLGDAERPLPAPILNIFLNNSWKAWIMFFWDNGNIWVHSIPGRPALDVITAALYFLGSIMVLVRYIRRRHWLDLFLLISVPLLMLPSILSLAFPDENPSLNRTGAAIVPVFILAAYALEGLAVGITRKINGRAGKTVAVGVGLLLISWSASNNFDLVFHQFDDQFMANAWNTSQIGEVIKNFATSIGSYDTAYVKPYPYWVDTRLVGINAGLPTRDYAIQLDQFKDTLAEPRPKLFILKPEDSEALSTLKSLYPTGRASLYDSGRPGKDFITFLVIP